MNKSKSLIRTPVSVSSGPQLLAVVLLAANVNVFGQASAVRPGSIEVGPFIGASYGVDKFRLMGGGNVTYAFKNKYVLPYVEYSYFPGIQRHDPGTVGGLSYVHNYSLALSDIHAGIHLRIPIFFEKPFVPYLVFGAGTLIYPGRNDKVQIPGFTIGIPVTVQGSADAAINGGGGLRYYIGGSGAFGLRTEAKFYRPLSGSFSGSTFGKVEVGFFFQLR